MARVRTRVRLATAALAPILALAAPACAVADGQVVRTLAVKHAGEIYEIGITDDSRLALTASTGDIVSGSSGVRKVWEIATGRVLAESSDADDVPALSLLGGVAVRTVGTATHDGGRRLELVEGGRPLATLAKDETPLGILRRGPALEVVALVSGEGEKRGDDSVRLHEGASRSPMTFRIAGSARAGGADCSAPLREARWLACGMVGEAVLVDLASGETRRTSAGRAEEKPVVALSADGQQLLTYVRSSREVMHWTVPDMSPVKRGIISFDEFAPRWSRIKEVVAGKVVRLEGARVVAFADVTTGKAYWAARGSSVNRFLLEAIDGHHFLRAHRNRSNPTTWGVIAHRDGDFKELYKIESKVALGSLVTSRNAKCLTLLADGGELSIVDPLTRRPHARAKGLPAVLYRGAITPDGRTFIVTGTDGRVMTVALPGVCQG